MNSLALAAMLSSTVFGAANDVPNPSFEQGDGDAPAGWEPLIWAGTAEFLHAEAGRTGKRSALIVSDAGADLAWSAVVPVKPYTQYRLSGWIKTEDVRVTTGRGAQFNLHGTEVKTDALVGTNDWTRLETVFETEDEEQARVNCLLGGWGLATGKAWFDDVMLEALSERDIAPAVRVDAGAVAPPLSKYVYGQFIEHLGRCIYGGIWAEMLEDRKFFYAVGAEESPWVPTGGAETVTMTRDDPFVGEHTPVIAAGGGLRGIAQEALGLLDGAVYVGYVIARGETGPAPLAVRIEWGDGPGDAATAAFELPAGEYTRLEFRFTADRTTDAARLLVTTDGASAVRIGTVSIMPADNVRGMRADTLALLKQLDAPVYRWPGGNFVSGYDWRDGIGDRDRRPPRKNPAWLGIEHNDFGLDEFIDFCRELGTEPYIAVNSGAGDAKAAADQVRYANGAADTQMGRLRAANGHPEPYGVEWWGIGNEMYGDWQIGHMPLERYVEKHNEFAAAMRAADPSITLVGVGATGVWSETMLDRCADHMEALSEHFYRQERPGVVSHVRQVVDAIRNKARVHREYHERLEGLRGKRIPIAMDEWNYWYGPHLYGELGTQYFLKDALGIAAGLHEYARNSDVYIMANYAQTVNVIGCVKTTKTAAAFDTTALPLMLYRREFGALPVAVEGNPAPLDVAAAWTDGRDALTIGVVNPMRVAVTVSLDVAGATLGGTGRMWLITGAGPKAHNVPGLAPEVTLTERPVDSPGDGLEIPPFSICLFRYDARPAR